MPACGLCRSPLQHLIYLNKLLPQVGHLGGISAHSAPALKLHTGPLPVFLQPTDILLTEIELRVNQ